MQKIKSILTESDIIRVNAIDLTGKIYTLPFDNQHIDVSNLTDGAICSTDIHKRKNEKANGL